MILQFSTLLLIVAWPFEMQFRREKINERMKLLQDLVPGCNKVRMHQADGYAHIDVMVLCSKLLTSGPVLL